MSRLKKKNVNLSLLDTKKNWVRPKSRPLSSRVWKASKSRTVYFSSLPLKNLALLLAQALRNWVICKIASMSSQNRSTRRSRKVRTCRHRSNLRRLGIKRLKLSSKQQSCKLKLYKKRRISSRARAKSNKANWKRSWPPRQSSCRVSWCRCRTGVVQMPQRKNNWLMRLQLCAPSWTQPSRRSNSSSCR